MRFRKNILVSLYSDSQPWTARRGAFAVLATSCLIVAIGFAALSVDLSIISLNKTKMQSAVDAAALAAAREVSIALEEAAREVQDVEVEGSVTTANDVAEQAGKDMAVTVGELNDVYINPETDVRFGQRTVDPVTGDFSIQWGTSPYNVVGVTASRENPDVNAPDGQLKLFFAPIFGERSTAITASAAAYIEARDIAMVLDYSGSMNDDSELRSMDTLGQEAVEDNIYKIWEDLDFDTYGNMGFDPDWVTIPGQPASGPVPHIDVTWKSTSVDVVSTMSLSNVVLRFSNGNTQTFNGLSASSGTFQGSSGNSGKLITKLWVKSGSNDSGDGPDYGEKFDFWDDDMMKKGLGLDGVAYPYESGSWNNYLDYARDSNGSTSWYDKDVYTAGYRRKFGMLTLINFWNRKKPRHHETHDLWKTRQYPVHAMKEGATLFLNFLDSLAYGDEVGLVTYDTTARVETGLDDEDSEVTVDLTGDLITNDYEGVTAMQMHKQAGYYDVYTNISDGIDQAIGLLQEHKRYGARPTILLMTDGNANRSVDSWSMPAGWDWNVETDYDDDGVADFTTSDNHKKSAIAKAKEAVDLGFTIHTLSVGNGADRGLMQAIAHIGGGIWVDVPGGASVAEMEAQMLEAFALIAANVPPAKLLNEEAP